MNMLPQPNIKSWVQYPGLTWQREPTPAICPLTFTFMSWQTYYPNTKQTNDKQINGKISNLFPDYGDPTFDFLLSADISSSFSNTTSTDLSHTRTPRMLFSSQFFSASFSHPPIAFRFIFHVNIWSHFSPHEGSLKSMHSLTTPP